YEKDIKPCMGCFACWASPDGTCAIKDDMAEIIAAIREADIIIESFPLYFYGMPSQLKAVTDRCLSLAEPYMGTRSDDGQTFNKMRDPSIFNKKFVVISSCGYVELEPVYPALLAQYDLICGGREKYTAILCPMGEVFMTGKAKRQIRVYLDDLKKAGAEYCANGFKLDPETIRKLQIPLLSPEGFATLTNSHMNEGGWAASRFEK
ncbi:MAG: flavodoxin family protein, partial [Candidatus Cryptobacteroides sp.]|nr:flavodoxin family protein [Candidatus Cryptobacteroides sp.]